MLNKPLPLTGYTPQFSLAVSFVLVAEGAINPDGSVRPNLGYVNDPHDAGGETKGGISKRAFPRLDIASLTLEKIVRIYHTNYWRAAHCKEWPAPVALAVFDAAVQHGVSTAIRLLQEIAGVKSDGLVGPITRAAVNALDPAYLVSRLGLRRSRLYARIIKKNTTQIRFIEGWHNRLVDVTDMAWRFL